jgi:hypothetical protein
VSHRYGHRHRAVREALLPGAYGRPCIHCGWLMLPGQPLDLDHRADGHGSRGMVHASCNRADGGRRGRAAQLRRRGGVFPK